MNPFSTALISQNRPPTESLNQPDGEARTAYLLNKKNTLEYLSIGLEKGIVRI